MVAESEVVDGVRRSALGDLPLQPRPVLGLGVVSDDRGRESCRQRRRKGRHHRILETGTGGL